MITKAEDFSVVRLCGNKSNCPVHKTNFQVEISHASLSDGQQLLAALEDTLDLDSFVCDPTVHSPRGPAALIADVFWRRELPTAESHAFIFRGK